MQELNDEDVSDVALMEATPFFPAKMRHAY